MQKVDIVVQLITCRAAWGEEFRISSSSLRFFRSLSAISA